MWCWHVGLVARVALLVAANDLAVTTNTIVFLIVALVLINTLLTTGTGLMPSKGMSLGMGKRGSVRAPVKDALLTNLRDNNVFLSSTYNNNNGYNRYHTRMLRKNKRVLPARGNFFSHGRVGRR